MKLTMNYKQPVQLRSNYNENIAANDQINSIVRRFFSSFTNLKT